MIQLPYASIVCPVDFSEASLAAVQVVRQSVRGDATVHVITVLEKPHAADPVFAWGNVDTEERERRAEAYLRQHLGPHAPEHVTIQAVVGNPALRIVEFADEVKADLIVIPTHGRSGAERVLIGSVTERVVRHARCPVLVLRRAD